MYKTIIVPRVSETDAIGHINNTTLPVWFEASRHDIFALFSPDHDFQTWKLIIVKTTLDFLNQIYFGKDVEIHTYVKKIGHTSLTLYEELYQSGKHCATNEVVYVNFNLSTQKTEPIPENIRVALQEHVYASAY